MVMRERKQMRPTFILDRGNYEARLEKVVAQTPGFLPGPDIPKKQTRLDLARWLVSDTNPLTSRVQVNRYWQLFFGVGLVKTAEDFGVQSELPSHPELLDWLAVEFRENDWNIKHIHRLIVTSETYLQSSKFRKELSDRDPENRWLARGARFRLPAMLIRDNALQVSGLLDRRLGGQPVFPWQPDRLWKEFSLERFGYRASKGTERYRRSLYTFWRRTVPPPNMFDSSNRQTCTVTASRTNTPLHALTLLNDPSFVEAACTLASQMIFDADTIERQNSESELLSSTFSHALARPPNQEEIIALKKAYQDSYEYYLEHPSVAKQYLAILEPAKLPKNELQKVRLAALSSVAQIIMNTDEFMTRE